MIPSPIIQSPKTRPTKRLVNDELRLDVETVLLDVIRQKRSDFEEARLLFKPDTLKKIVKRTFEGLIDTRLENMFNDAILNKMSFFIEDFFTNTANSKLIEKKIRLASQEQFSKMLNSLELIKKVEKVVDSYLNEMLYEEKLHNEIKQRAYGYIKNNSQAFVTHVVESIVKDMNKKMDKEFRITKELCGSIESEIKHTMMRLPVSVSLENEIKLKIKQIGNKYLQGDEEFKKLTMEEFRK